MSLGKAARLAFVCCFLLFCSTLSAVERPGADRLLQDGGLLSGLEPGGVDAPTGEIRWTGAPSGGWSGFWREHRYHILTVFLAEQVEYQYASRVGTSRSSLLFDEVPGFDEAVYRGVAEDRQAGNFVALHKTNLFRGVALATILAANGSRWGQTADDLMGLIEATKFNTATTSLVKMIVGRRRPELDQVDPGEVTPQQFDDIQAQSSGHLSFYSQATSQAFTMASYLDRVLARRLEGHRFGRVAGGVGLYGLAAYIGYTRLEQGEHYLTDVLAGAGAGFAVGYVFYRVNHREEFGEKDREGRAQESRIRFNPPALVPGGVMLSFSVDL